MLLSASLSWSTAIVSLAAKASLCLSKSPAETWSKTERVMASTRASTRRATEAEEGELDDDEEEETEVAFSSRLLPLLLARSIPRAIALTKASIEK